MRISRIALTLAAVALLCACGSTPAANADRTRSIVVGDITRTYVVHVPVKLASPLPLLIVFHGHLGTGAEMSKLTQLDTLSDKDGFIVVYPNGIHRGWNDGRSARFNADDIGFTRALVARFSADYPVDARRVYAVGFSNGATLSQVVGCRLSGLIAAIAPVSGSIPSVDVAGCKPQRPISVLEIAGDSDPIMPYNGGIVKGIERGTVISAKQSVAFWAKNAHCAPAPSSSSLASIVPSDGTRVSRAVYPACAAGTSVQFYTIENGGHTWPGGPQYAPAFIIGKASTQLDASRVIVEFLLAHPSTSSG